MYLIRPPFFYKWLYTTAVFNKPQVNHTIYLTFDDGPIPEITPSVLDILKEKGVEATFFCVGENVQRYPEIAARIVSENHVIGNHTYNHLDAWKCSSEDYIKNTLKFKSPKGAINLFRPPYGKLKPSQYKQLKEKFSVVFWDVLSGDYDANTSPEKCLSNVISRARNGSIIVFHDNIKAKENLLYTLPRFIDYAKEKGYALKSL